MSVERLLESLRICSASWRSRRQPGSAHPRDRTGSSSSCRLCRVNNQKQSETFPEVEVLLIRAFRLGSAAAMLRQPFALEHSYRVRPRRPYRGNQAQPSRPQARVRSHLVAPCRLRRSANSPLTGWQCAASGLRPTRGAGEAIQLRLGIVGPNVPRGTSALTGSLLDERLLDGRCSPRDNGAAQ